MPSVRIQVLGADRVIYNEYKMLFILRSATGS